MIEKLTILGKGILVNLAFVWNMGKICKWCLLWLVMHVGLLQCIHNIIIINLFFIFKKIVNRCYNYVYSGMDNSSGTSGCLQLKNFMEHSDMVNVGRF